MTIESLAFSSSASGLSAGAFAPAATCTLTFHMRMDGVEPARSVLGWSHLANPPAAADGDTGEAAQAGASTLRRRSLTITF